MVSYHPDPPQLLRARLRLALHSRGGENLNRLVHHERGRYLQEVTALIRAQLELIHLDAMVNRREIVGFSCRSDSLIAT